MKPADAPKVIDIYCRISVDYDGTTRSVDSQEDDCLLMLSETPGVEPGLALKDHAKSGWKRGVVRKSFLALMARLESGESDGVIFYDVSRFTRKPIEAERLLELADRGVMVLSVVNTYDLTTPIGRKNFREEAIAAAYESDKIHERTTRGKKKRALIQGRSNATMRGFARPGLAPKPEGWQPGDSREMVPAEQVAHEREIVRELADRFLKGEPLAQICRDLNDRGEPGPSKTHGWVHSGARLMLKRPELAGHVVYRGEIVPGKMLEGDHALTVETFEAVQARFAAGKRGRPLASAQLLASHATCGKCGHTIFSRQRYNGKGEGAQFHEDGTQKRQYYCAPSRPGREGACGALSIDQRAADAIVKAATIARLDDPSNHVAARQQLRDAEAAPLLAALERLDADEQAIASKMGERGLAWVETASKSIWEQQAKIKAKLDALSAVESLPLPTDTAERWAAAEAAGDIAALRDRVRLAFPNLAILPQAYIRQDPAERIALDGVNGARAAA